MALEGIANIRKGGVVCLAQIDAADFRTARARDLSDAIIYVARAMTMMGLARMNSDFVR